MTCDLNTLWQRFGRAARGTGTIGIAILFVEAKYFDEEKEKAAENAAKRAEKASEKAAEREKRKRKQGENQEGARKRARTSGGDAPATTVPASEGPVEKPELSPCEQLRVEYRKVAQIRSASRRQSMQPQKGGNKPNEIAPEIDNLINADRRGFRCFRVPIMAYFENDHVKVSRSSCAQSFGTDINYVMTSLTITGVCQTQSWVALVVASPHLLSVALCVIPTIQHSLHSPTPFRPQQIGRLFLDRQDSRPSAP